MWDLPGPGIEPVSPALAGGFLTTVPPGKSCASVFKGSGSIIDGKKICTGENKEITNFLNCS